VVSSSPRGEDRLLTRVVAPLARSKINLTFLAHVAGDREVLCTAGETGEAALTLLKSRAEPQGSLELEAGSAVLALYPHDKRPEIIGNFIRSLARARVILHGLASSPSAISAVLASRRKRAAVEQLFRDFQFSSFASPRDFFEAQPPPEEYLQKVVATYQEKTIKVYWIVPQPDLDLWGMSISTSEVLEGLAEALMDLAELGLKVPFLVALPGLGGKEFIVSFSTARPMRLTPVAGIFLHGPHFGDRYGIAQTLLEALGRARVTLLALSCTISSVSLIIRQQELAQAQLVLTQTFAAPVECAPAAGG
jgi:hypothetical protein